MKVTVFVSEHDSKGDIVTKIAPLYAAFPEMEIETVIIEEEPARAKEAGVGATPFIVVEGRTFGGIPSPGHLSEVLSEKKSYELKTLSSGNIYLLDDRDREESLSLFAEAVAGGRKGLCITRRHPGKVREKYPEIKFDIAWLTKNAIPDEQCLDPQNITRLSMIITRFVQLDREGVIILDGVEYLISQHDFKTILRFLQSANDSIMISRSIMLVPVNLRTMNDEQKSLLAQEMIPLGEVEKGEMS